MNGIMKKAYGPGDYAAELGLSAAGGGLGNLAGTTGGGLLGAGLGAGLGALGGNPGGGALIGGLGGGSLGGLAGSLIGRQKMLERSDIEGKPEGVVQMIGDDFRALPYSLGYGLGGLGAGAAGGGLLGALAGALARNPGGGASLGAGLGGGLGGLAGSFYGDYKGTKKIREGRAAKKKETKPNDKKEDKKDETKEKAAALLKMAYGVEDFGKEIVGINLGGAAGSTGGAVLGSAVGAGAGILTALAGRALLKRYGLRNFLRKFPNLRGNEYVREALRSTGPIQEPAVLGALGGGVLGGVGGSLYGMNRGQQWMGVEGAPEGVGQMITDEGAVAPTRVGYGLGGAALGAGLGGLVSLLAKKNPSLGIMPGGMGGTIAGSLYGDFRGRKNQRELRAAAARQKTASVSLIKQARMLLAFAKSANDTK